LTEGLVQLAAEAPVHRQSGSGASEWWNAPLKPKRV
jgi:hypothetical protein